MILIDSNKCDLCGTCVGVCPVNVISMSVSELSIDQETCIDCRRCTWVCPVHALTYQSEKEQLVSEK